MHRICNRSIESPDNLRGLQHLESPVSLGNRRACSNAGAAEWILRWGGSWHFFQLFGGFRSFFREILLGEKSIFWKFSKVEGAQAPPAPPPLPPPMFEWDVCINDWRRWSNQDERSSQWLIKRRIILLHRYQLTCFASDEKRSEATSLE